MIYVSEAAALFEKKGSKLQDLNIFHQDWCKDMFSYITHLLGGEPVDQFCGAAVLVGPPGADHGR